jgi:hypothetical protein
MEGGWVHLGDNRYGWFDCDNCSYEEKCGGYETCEPLAILVCRSGRLTLYSNGELIMDGGKEVIYYLLKKGFTIIPEFLEFFE